MKSLILEFDDDALDSVLDVLKRLPKQVKITENINLEYLDDENNIWKLLRESGLEDESDASIEHDHYIHGSPKINQ